MGRENSFLDEKGKDKQKRRQARDAKRGGGEPADFMVPDFNIEGKPPTNEIKKEPGKEADEMMEHIEKCQREIELEKSQKILNIGKDFEQGNPKNFSEYKIGHQIELSGGQEVEINDLSVDQIRSTFPDDVASYMELVKENLDRANEELKKRYEIEEKKLETKKKTEIKDNSNDLGEIKDKPSFKTLALEASEKPIVKTSAKEKMEIEDKKKYLLENIEKISGGEAKKLFFEIYGDIIKKKLYTENIAEGYMIIKGFGVKEKEPFVGFGDDREDKKPFGKRKRARRKIKDMPKLSDVEKLLEKYKYQFTKKEVKEKLEEIKKNGTEKREIRGQEPSEDLLKSKAEFIFSKRMENDPEKDPNNPYNGKRIDAILKRNNITPGTLEAGEFMKNWDWKEAERLAKEEIKLKGEIEKVQTFDGLLATIDKYEGIHGSREFFPKHILKRCIAGISKGDKTYEIKNITRSLGLREKVEDLLRKEEKELSKEQLNLFEESTREFYEELKQGANWEGYEEGDIKKTLAIQTKVYLRIELKKLISDENKIDGIANKILEKIGK